MPLHESYKCHCMTPVPLIDEWHEDSGLCQACNGVYDERLYENQLRKRQPGLPEGGDLDEILQTIDPRYRALNAQ